MATGTFHEGKVLLWNNSSPTSNFAGQDIPVNTVGFDQIQIVFQMNKSTYVCYSLMMDIGTPSTDEKTYAINTFMNFDSASALLVVRRNAEAYSSYCHFGDCKKKSSTSTSAATVDNQYLIPLQIYGIRYK